MQSASYQITRKHAARHQQRRTNAPSHFLHPLHLLHPFTPSPLEQALQEKKSIVIRAEGEAESARLISSAIADSPGFIQMRRIDAAKEVRYHLSSSFTISHPLFAVSTSLSISTPYHTVPTGSPCHLHAISTPSPRVSHHLSPSLCHGARGARPHSSPQKYM